MVVGEDDQTEGSSRRFRVIDFVGCAYDLEGGFDAPSVFVGPVRCDVYEVFLLQLVENIWMTGHSTSKSENICFIRLLYNEIRQIIIFFSHEIWHTDYEGGDLTNTR